MILRTKLLAYVLLFGLTLISGIVLVLVCIFITSSRETGMAWGICAGIFCGHIGLAIFQKHKIVPAILTTIIYSLSVFLFMYAITNYIKALAPTVKFILYGLSVIISWEISQFVVYKTISVKETTT
jgi:uncharacterized membrane protein (UPF0136 family)